MGKLRKQIAHRFLNVVLNLVLSVGLILILFSLSVEGASKKKKVKPVPKKKPSTLSNRSAIRDNDGSIWIDDHPNLSQESSIQNRQIIGLSQTFLWVGPKGEVIKNTWPIKAEWLWDRLHAKDKFKSPVMRLIVKIPTWIDVKKFEISDGKITLSKDASLEDLSSNSQILKVYTTATQAAIQLDIKDSTKTYPNHISLLIVNKFTTPFLWVHDNCLQGGFILTPRGESKLPYFYLAAYCHDDGISLKVRFFWSEDVRIRSFTLPLEGGAKELSSSYLLPKTLPKSDKPLSFPQMGLIVLEKGSRLGKKKDVKTAEINVEWHPRPTPKRFTQTISLGPSFLNYSENPQGIHIKQLSLTGKFSVTYWLVPEKWDLSGNTYFSIISLFSSRSGLDHLGVPRFYGINGRVGYKVRPTTPGGPLDMGVKISAGWYLWGMQNSDSRYGVALLGGPQFFVLADGKTNGDGRSYGTSFKIAPISDQIFSASLDSMELAVGGSYQINSHYELNPILGTLDIARASMRFSNANNRISLFSFSLGLSYGL